MVTNGFLTTLKSALERGQSPLSQVLIRSGWCKRAEAVGAGNGVHSLRNTKHSAVTIRYKTAVFCGKNILFFRLFSFCTFNLKCRPLKIYLLLLFLQLHGFHKRESPLQQSFRWPKRCCNFLFARREVKLVLIVWSCGCVLLSQTSSVSLNSKQNNSPIHEDIQTGRKDRN